jgi:CHAT domain-containing protein
MWWALQFGIARWLAGRRPPADEIEFKRVCCIAATHSQLSSADKELEYLRGLGIMIDEPKTRADLLKQLRTEDYDVIHFACHGNFDQDQPSESVIQLPDRSQLAPADLYDADIEERMNKKRPLVFINSCHSGRAGPAITGLGGWAERFIEMGCGAFIGCGWEVADPLAAEFAIGFYKRLRHKEPLGQAVQLTREQIRKTNPKNSTWLAYFLYGNPYCHLKM